MRKSLLTVVIFLSAISLSSSANAQTWAFLKTDKRNYRRGETIWFTIHKTDKDKSTYSVSLLDSSGTSKYTSEFRYSSKFNSSDSIFLDSKMIGGNYRLRLERNGVKVDELDLRVFALKQAKLRVRLDLVNNEYYAGDTLTAVVHVADLRQLGLANYKVEYRAKFGAHTLTGFAGKTDKSGHCKITLEVPDYIRRSGTLDVGVQKGRVKQAISKAVKIKSGVEGITIHSEFNTVIEDREQDFAYFVQDYDGEGVSATGRIVDQNNAFVCLFSTDSSGHGISRFRVKKDKRYKIIIDRPLDVTKKWPIAQAERTNFGLQVKTDKNSFRFESIGKLKGASLIIYDWKKQKVIVNRDFNYANEHFENLSLRRMSVVIAKDNRILRRQDYLLGNCPNFEVTQNSKNLSNIKNNQLKITIPKLGVRSRSVSITTDLNPLSHKELYTRFLLQNVAENSDIEKAFKSIGSSSKQLKVISLMYLSYAYSSPCGVKTKNSKDLSSFFDNELFGRVKVQRNKQRPEINTGAIRSKEKPSEMTRLMDEAPYTTQIVPTIEKSDRLVAANPSAEFNWTGLNKRQAKSPQKLKRSAFSNRQTVYWSANSPKSKSRGELEVHFNSIDRKYLIEVAAMTEKGPVYSYQYAELERPFKLNTNIPESVHLGDNIELDNEINIVDGSREKVHVSMNFTEHFVVDGPSSWTYDPRVSPKTFPVRFRVVKRSKGAVISIRVKRGLLEQRIRVPVTINEKMPLLTLGISGYAKGKVTRSIFVPKNAIPESTSVESTVVSNPSEAAGIELEFILGEPHGCFEQSSSSNYPNLVILDSLRSSPTSPELLARTIRLAKKGLKKIKTFQQSDGGFALWPNGSSTTYYTAYAVMQLALYTKLFDGEGWRELTEAISYLSNQQLDPATEDYVDFALSEAVGEQKNLIEQLSKMRQYRKAKTKSKATQYKPNLYQIALRANSAFESKAQQSKDFATLKKAIKQDLQACLAKTNGIMGSSNSQLSQVVLALAIPLLNANGEDLLAQESLTALLKARKTQYGGTQALALTIRALSRVPVVERPTIQPANIKLNGRAIARWKNLNREKYDSKRSSTTKLVPGSMANFSLQLPRNQYVHFKSTVAYRLAKVTNAKNSPFKLTVTQAKRYIVGQTKSSSISVSIIKRDSTVRGQIVASISIPGGLTVNIDKFREDNKVIAKVEMINGHLTVYWNDIESVYDFTIPVSVVTAGQFSSGNSVIYAYYQDETEAFSPSSQIKIFSKNYYDPNAETHY